jgi:hypothetical protein
VGFSAAVGTLQQPSFAAEIRDVAGDGEVNDANLASNAASGGIGLKPYAPVSALLPATRAKLWIQEAHQLSTKLSAAGSGQPQEETLRQLDDVLSHRPKLFVKGEKLPQRVGSTALAQFTARQESDRAYRSATATMMPSGGRDPFADGPSLGELFSSALNRADVARQWGILQAQESKNESQNELRAAWNYYTQQLQFNPSSYEWNASVEEKRKRIRNDQLPTPQAVIVSDLDLRDLYRNQMLTALDDVAAEVKYHLKQTEGNGGDKRIDVSDAVDLMNQAYVACNKWFDMIDQNNVKEAEAAVRKEKHS